MTTLSDPRARLALAVDAPTLDAARRIIDDTADHVGVFKIGLELLFAGGLDLARELAAAGRRVFLDVKLLDIDNTVAGAIRTIAGTGVEFVTLHAYPNTMAAAIAARGDAPLTLLGVTVLTSMDEADLHAAGYSGTPADLVEHRARAARALGMDGLVCSAREVARVRALVGPEMVLVTPGIRPAGADVGDQKRVVTPAQAIRDGASLLVVGRPITAAEDRAGAARRILDEIASAL
ncbi:orotidine-5'-phosphate decarboxylase [Segnochrobactraceae bacterium EtOH-i3]